MFRRFALAIMAPYLPVIAALVVVAVGVGWRVIHHRRRYGSAGVAAFRGATWRERTPEMMIAALALVLLGEAVAWAVWPGRLASAVVARPRDRTGAVVILLGLAILVRAQADLGASWRIGIDAAARPGLVRHGLYRITRNPIFLGMFVILGGFVLLMPTALSLLVVACAFLVVRAQVLREETYLAAAYGADYRSYARRVGRFLPWIGRFTPPGPNPS